MFVIIPLQLEKVARVGSIGVADRVLVRLKRDADFLASGTFPVPNDPAATSMEVRFEADIVGDVTLTALPMDGNNEAVGDEYSELINVPASTFEVVGVGE